MLDILSNAERLLSVDEVMQLGAIPMRREAIKIMTNIGPCQFVRQPIINENGKRKYVTEPRVRERDWNQHLINNRKKFLNPPKGEEVVNTEKMDDEEKKEIRRVQVLLAKKEMEELCEEKEPYNPVKLYQGKYCRVEKKRKAKAGVSGQG